MSKIMEFDVNYYVEKVQSIFSKPAKPPVGIKKPLGPKSTLQTPKNDDEKEPG